MTTQTQQPADIAAQLELIYSPIESLRTITITTNQQDILNITYQENGKTYNGRIPSSDIRKHKQYMIGQQIVAGKIKETSPPMFTVTNPLIILAAMEDIIPEVRQGKVIVMGIASCIGIRTKIAVAPTQPDIDPVSVCVGKGHRRIDYIRNILQGEQIDMIAYNLNPETYIYNSIQPARAEKIELKDGNNADVYVPTHQMSAAVGGGGLNAKLASDLTGWKIKIKEQT